MISLTVLKEPLIAGDKINKGAMILSDVDEVVKQYPELKTYFYLIERRGWEGMNLSEQADIKLVEDSSMLDKTEKRFPNTIVLDIAGGDFVDIENFKPLKIEKQYTGIQISAWQKFKRPELFFNGVKLLPDKKFIKFGHLFYGGQDKKELAYKNEWVSFSKENCPNVSLPYGELQNNKNLPNNPKIINKLINKSKMGVLTSKVEGINRFKMECLSANIPVLVPDDANIPLKKHINNQTGLLYEPTPEGLAKAITYVENNYNSFSPREYVLRNTGNKVSIDKLKNALKLLAERDKSKNIYKDIYWDGRNQSLIWEEKAFKLIKHIMKRYHTHTK